MILVIFDCFFKIYAFIWQGYKRLHDPRWRLCQSKCWLMLGIQNPCHSGLSKANIISSLQTLTVLLTICSTLIKTIIKLLNVTGYHQANLSTNKTAYVSCL